MTQLFLSAQAPLPKLAKEVAEEVRERIWTWNPSLPRRIGRVLGKMRLKADRSSNKRRGWKMTVGDLLGWLTAYGIEMRLTNSQN